MRKFYINMTQKSNLQNFYPQFIKLGYISFSKTAKRQTQIVTIDFDSITAYYEREKAIYLANGNGGYLSPYTDGIERILGINKSNPYYAEALRKECTKMDI